MNKYTLKLDDKEAEAEYNKLKYGNISENIKIILFFLAIIQFSSGIPALVSKNYLGFCLSVSVVILLVIISLLGKKLNKYKQLMAFIVLATYHFTRPFFLPQDFTASQAQVMLRGYNFAALQIPLIIRFPEWNQKTWGVIITFGLRFILTGLLDVKVFEPEVVLRNLMICGFLTYIFYSNDRTERQVFLSYYTSREKLAKFKQLVVNYLPQSIVILNPLTNKCLFVNKAFQGFFNETEPEELFQDQQLERFLSNQNEKFRTQLSLLQIQKDTIRELGILEPHKDFTNMITIKQVLNEIAVNRSLGNKALSFTASCIFNNLYFLFEVIVTKIRWDEEDAVAVILNDITSQEKILSLKISNENKDKVLATVSHELRTPLNGIIGILDIAENKVKKQPEVIEYLDLCKDNAKLLLGLVNSILDIQQVRQGKLKLNINKVNIRKILNDVVKLFVFQCKQKEIFLNLHIDEGVPDSVNTDENRLKQILINLVGNAIKFTSQGGITVGISQDEKRIDYLKLWVADTGIGIKEEDKENLFKMYGKLKDGESVNENGVGLGLMISNALAVLLSGKNNEKGIEIESAFGKGAKFEFRILKNLQKSGIQGVETPKTEKDGHDNSGFSNNFEDSLMYLDIKEEAELPESVQSRMAYHAFMKSLAALNRGPHLVLVSNERPKSMDSVDIKPTGEAILVVDDNPFNLMVVENVLNRIGYMIKKAQSGKEALEEVKAITRDSQKFKIILMDCNMPIMDGYETTRVLKKMMRQGEIYETPIVALSASNAEEDIKKCFECGMSDYLMKPLVASDFNQVLRKVT